MAAFVGTAAVVQGAVLPPGEGPGRIENAVLGTIAGCVALVALSRWLWPGVGWRGHGYLLGSAACYARLLVLWLPFMFLVYPWLLERCGVELEPQPALRYFSEPPATPWGPWVVIFGACVAAPVGEELLFRGYLLTAMQAVMPSRLALLLVAAVFGLFHGWLYALPAGVLGFGFGWLRLRYACLAAPIVAHALHNTLTLTALFVLSPETLDTLRMR